MLEEILKQRIKKEGSIDLYTYLQLCQAHQQYGYYTQKHATEILGPCGDFVTAPEISPLFGEIIAFWVVSQWERLGSPSKLYLLELGPGQGTLMEGILKTFKKLKSFKAECIINFLEVNHFFQQMQREKIQFLGEVFHHSSLEFLETLNHPLIVIANEFFDALPVHQYIQRKGKWYEVGVNLNNLGELQYTDLLYEVEKAPEFQEYQPDTIDILAKVYTHLNRCGGAGLVIDYGYWEGQGNSVQAVYKHQKVDVLKHPGKADISVHVNFKNMALYSQKYDLCYSYQTQSQFLKDFGIQLRLKQLYPSLPPRQAEVLLQGVKRLIDPAEMGHVFKVLQIWKI